VLFSANKVTQLLHSSEHKGQKNLEIFKTSASNYELKSNQPERPAHKYPTCCAKTTDFDAVKGLEALWFPCILSLSLPSSPIGGSSAHCTSFRVAAKRVSPLKWDKTLVGKTADSRKFTITLLHTYMQTHAILLFGSRKVHPQYKKQKLSIGTRQLLQEGKATNTEMIHGVLHLAVCFGAVILRHCTLFLEPQLRKNRLRTPKDFETAKL